MRLTWARVAVLCCTLASACSTQTSKQATPGRVAPGARELWSSATVSEAALPGRSLPPPGRWRIAPRHELAQVVLWVSHILIRHRDAQPSDVPFAPFGWSVQPPPPARTRERAFELASSIADEARRLPQSFADLARKYSEDTLTREQGGTLGGVPVSHLIEAETMLDALAVLKPGQVSPVLETSYGFHVLLRRAPPPAQEIAARRIVLGHDQAPWLGAFRRSAFGNARRTRQEARALAEVLVRELRAQPDAFAAFVERHSEHLDAQAGGDIGLWSNHEPSPYRRQIERLSAMQVGEIGDPIETPMGFEILQRTPAHARTRYTIAAIKLSFLPSAAPERSESLASTRSKAESMLRFLKAQAGSTFQQFQAQYCCTQHERWTYGRGDRELSAALDAVEVGTILNRVFVVDDNVVIAEKLAPEPDPEPRFELPAPAVPNLEYFVAHVPVAQLDRYVSALTTQLAAALQLEGDKRGEFERVHSRSAALLHRAEPAERAGILSGTLLATRELLGARDFERYMSLVNSDVARVLMQ